MYMKEHFGEWEPLLGPFLYSEEFKKIGIALNKQHKAGIEVTPKFSDMFRAFRLCSPFKMHTIFIGQDSYYQKISNNFYVADGLAFSSRYSKSCPKSLQYIYQAIDREIYDGENTSLTDTFDLEKWAIQGILLTNCSLSTTIGKAGAHMDLWRPFTEYLLKTINKRRDSLCVVLVGKDAQKYESLLTNPTYKILKCVHPAYAAYKKIEWDSNNIFKELVKFQRKQNNISIKW